MPFLDDPNNMTRQELKQELTRLSDEINFPDATSKRNRGRDFEKLIHSLLQIEGLNPNSNFRPDGEEIDGSFVLGQKVFLFEAKWHRAEMPASSIYQFKGKVDGKLVGTIGIYISMSGFSSEAVDALSYGKSINIILFDRSDFTTCIYENDGFKNVLQKKIRIATEKGIAFFPIISLAVSSEPTTTKSKVLITQTNTSNFLAADTATKKHYDLVFIVEGNSDQRIIASFAEKIFQATNKRKEINIIVAAGKFSVAKIANSIQKSLDDRTKLVLVADSDFDREETLILLMKNLDNKNVITIIPDPEIEYWFTNSQIKSGKELRNIASHSGQEIGIYIEQLVDEIDIEKLKQTDKAFRQFYEVLTN